MSDGKNNNNICYMVTNKELRDMRNNSNSVKEYLG